LIFPLTLPPFTGEVIEMTGAVTSTYTIYAAVADTLCVEACVSVVPTVKMYVPADAFPGEAAVRSALPTPPGAIVSVEVENVPLHPLGKTLLSAKILASHEALS